VDTPRDASTRPSLDGSTTSDLVGHIEPRGIDVIPDSERHGRPSELFWVWFTSNFTFLYILFGGILISLGLSLWQALTIAIIGNLFFILVGVISIPGPRSGTASMVISRSQYGIRGSGLSSLLNWIILVGFEAVDFSIAAFALYALCTYFGWHLSTPVKVLILAVVILATFILGLYGHATIVFFQRSAAWIVAIASVLLFALIVPHVHFSYHPAAPLHGGAATAALLVALSIVMSGPLSYPVGADYSRYLPADASAKRIVWYTAIGGYIPSVVLTGIGIFAATAVNPADFTTSLRAIVPGWFYVVFLLAVALGMTANNVIGVYSSGLSLQALGVKLRRSLTIWFDVILGSVLTVYGVFIATNFLTALSNFLLWAVYWYAPFFGIYIVDMILTRSRYDGYELFKTGGRYWYDRGYRWRGLAALIIGMVVTAMFSQTYYYKGPISTHLLDNGDLSAISGLVVGAAAYWLLCGRATRRALSERAGQVPMVSQKPVPPGDLA
jgi:NCS1 family nucleobase:cation symporter-1